MSKQAAPRITYQIKICIRTVPMPKSNAEKAMPKIEVRTSRGTLGPPKPVDMHAEDVTTCMKYNLICRAFKTPL
jgi:hypothetical protein